MNHLFFALCRHSFSPASRVFLLPISHVSIQWPQYLIEYVKLSEPLGKFQTSSFQSEADHFRTARHGGSTASWSNIPSLATALAPLSIMPRIVGRPSK
ncbi:hypothetical protein IFM61606_01262 [Aspergillus udagawae]|uniref:Secreted protein n=1 Tax=Aspergillus udagawae TaxID=91492 RepID=A0ABQ1A498_9EURO|nr:hypothetical protein IFM51744_03915 [Aspergillus udagawae]GFF73190.1 hypothetical protein IFM53868_01006 [Aspergillus udagawae]GFG07046.1 hypothetical protein IFM5058_03228 [Aspergillus udagawae]GFG21393.1 hypothetical protein IFM61606_01262 [Aspergillus udagawae]